MAMKVNRVFLIAEFSLNRNETVQSKLDGFREAVQPSREYGITLYRPEHDVDAALLACTQLIAAYQRGAEAGGSVDWEDLDTAYETARKVFGTDAAKAREEHAEGSED
jgi:hypothetical protein